MCLRFRRPININLGCSGPRPGTHGIVAFSERVLDRNDPEPYHQALKADDNFVSSSLSCHGEILCALQHRISESSARLQKN